MRVLMCGDRNWNDGLSIKRQLQSLKDEHGNHLLVITGGATGADHIVEQHCKEMGIDNVIYPANWVGQGKAAGPLRNLRMLSEGKPDRVVAFHNFLPSSKGTKHMVSLAERHSIPVLVVKKTERVFV